jgi:ABC-type dipeptide/oligopeptide/nickel transport system permease subunit
MAEAASQAPRRNKRVLFGAAVVALLVAAAAAAPLLAPHDPLEQNLLLSFLPPFWRSGGDPGFPLGTDGLGRDILSRLIYGARIALAVALVAATLAALLGTVLGLLAGYYGGLIDALVSRLVDVWMSFPPLSSSTGRAFAASCAPRSWSSASRTMSWPR